MRLFQWRKKKCGAAEKRQENDRYLFISRMSPVEYCALLDKLFGEMLAENESLLAYKGCAPDVARMCQERIDVLSDLKEFLGKLDTGIRFSSSVSNGIPYRKIYDSVAEHYSPFNEKGRILRSELLEAARYWRALGEAIDFFKSALIEAESKRKEVFE